MLTAAAQPAELMSAADIIDENGGPAAFAAKVGTTAGAVRVWKHRNRFPREAWPEINQAFPDLTFDRLLEIEAAASEPTRESA